MFDEKQNEKELLEAMASGVRSYLTTTRGAHKFGANTLVELDGEYITVLTKDRNFVFQVVD